ncbi:MAG: hypothetical protein H0X34_16300 [Chthoniobacterales bacterium]|nr:hypothetical protein [Chthoniobacterales bacterium]
MKIEDSHIYERVILAIEVAGFSILLAVLWLDEYVDVPFRFLGALKTPLRPQEFWFEALSVLLVATAVITATLWVFRRLRILEAFVQVCAWCRKVNVEDEWVSFEQYLKRELDVQSTHGICPECRANAARRPAAVPEVSA